MSFSRLPIKQSAVLPYRVKGEVLEFLLITSLSTGRWVIPKGHIEAKLSAQLSAEKEAFEEAGLKGTVFPDKLGEYLYHKRELGIDGARQVEVFAMLVETVLEDWPEKSQRRRCWMTGGEAAGSLHEAELGTIILDFENRWRRGNWAL